MALKNSLEEEAFCCVNTKTNSHFAVGFDQSPYLHIWTQIIIDCGNIILKIGNSQDFLTNSHTELSRKNHLIRNVRLISKFVTSKPG